MYFFCPGWTVWCRVQVVVLGLLTGVVTDWDTVTL